MWHWLLHLLGTDDPSGYFYNFWSGFGADLGELAIIGAAIGVYRRHNCHVHRCWRIAKQEVLGTSWRVCHRHHPLGKPTEADIAAHHEVLLATRRDEAAVLEARARRARDRQDDPEADPLPVEVVVPEADSRPAGDPVDRPAEDRPVAAGDVHPPAT